MRNILNVSDLVTNWTTLHEKMALDKTLLIIKHIFLILQERHSVIFDLQNGGVL